MVSMTVAILTSLIILLVATFRKKIATYLEFRKKIKKLPTTAHNFLLGHVWKLIVPPSKFAEASREVFLAAPPIFVFWLGPIPSCMLKAPKHIETILGSSHLIEKAFLYSFLRPWLGTGLLTSSGSKWYSRRKMITPAFHFTILENFIETFAEKSKIMVKVLQREIGKENFDVTAYVSKCTLDIICETAMGVEINAQEAEESEYVDAVNRMTVEVRRRLLWPCLYVDFIYYLTPGGRRFRKYLTTLHDFTNKVIKERRQQHKRAKMGEEPDEDRYLGKRRKMAFLDLLLDYSANGRNLTDEDIREEVDTFMFEGHDTTSVAICWTLYAFSVRPKAQEKVYEELQSIFGDSDRSPTMKDLSEMKYLERVIKEMLRLAPSVPMFGRILSKDVEIDGYTLPKGLMVGFLPPVIHRDPETFPDPEEFNPDNFLPERNAERHPYAYIPFSAGPRNCIGQKFALLEEKTMLSYILRNYRIEDAGIEPIPLPDLILRSYNGYHIKITPRSSVNQK